MVGYLRSSMPCHPPRIEVTKSTKMIDLPPAQKKVKTLLPWVVFVASHAGTGKPQTYKAPLEKSSKHLPTFSPLGRKKKGHVTSCCRVKSGGISSSHQEGHRFLLNGCHFSWVLRHPTEGIIPPLFLNQGIYNIYVYTCLYMLIYSYKHILVRIDFYSGFWPMDLTLQVILVSLPTSPYHHPFFWSPPSHRVVSLSFSGSSWGLPTRLPFTKRLKVWRFGPQKSQWREQAYTLGN